ncbi:MAG: bestrophin family ion channel [Tatlockia sp.]
MNYKSHDLLTWVHHLFLFYKDKVFRKLIPIMLVIIIYASTIAHFFEHATRLNLGQFHLIFSFILTIVISFRVNSSYARWWEGRILWGAIVNNCRDLGMKFETFAGLNAHPQFNALLTSFPKMLKAFLRKDKKTIREECLGLGIDDFAGKQPVLLLIQRMYFIINQLRNEDHIRFEQYMALDMHLVGLNDTAGGCERIAKTPVPQAFSFFVKQALLFYTLMFPFGWAETFGFAIIPIMVMIVYILLGLEILSEELEDPFGKDDNDLPLDVISRKIALDIKQIRTDSPL